MQLLIGIIQAEDTDALCRQLNAAGIRVTTIDTVGAFLAQRNTTLLLGVEDDQIEEVLDAIRATCRTRIRYINPLPYGPESVPTGLVAPSLPLEVEVGGATVFCLPVGRYVRSRGREVLPGAAGDEGPGGAIPTPEKGAPAAGTAESRAMKLIVSIVHKEDADLVTGGLLAAGYRATRINTAGAFLRRGNVTLLIGVEDEQVDDVLRIIQSNCRYRDEPGPVSAGMPAYSATTFVLDVGRVVRV